MMAMHASRIYRPPVTPGAAAMYAVAGALEVPFGTLRGPSRRRYLARGRFAVMLALHRHHVSYPNIARVVGRSDHTTAIHGVQEAMMLEREPDFQRLVIIADAAYRRKML